MPLTTPYSDGIPTISFVALDSAGQVVAASNPDTVYYAASTIKLAVLAATMRRVEDGTLALDQPVTVKDTFPSRIPGADAFTFDPDETDQGLPAPGQTVTLAECLGRMIHASSNAATNLAIDLVGLAEVDAALALCGAPTAKMERLISDHDARDAGFTHEASALDLARMMRAIVTGEVCGPTETAFMLEQLRRQEFPVIGTALGPDVVWGSKSGWVDGIHHDVAFVGEPAHPGSYVLAVCTRGFGESEAKTAIAAIASATNTLLLR